MPERSLRSDHVPERSLRSDHGSEPALPQRVIDAHMHQWDPIHTPREVSLIVTPLHKFPGLLKAALRLLPQAERETFGDPYYISHPYLPLQYGADVAALHIDTVVHIESSWYGHGRLAPANETSWVAQLPFTRPRLGAIVAAANPAASRFAELLDAHLEASPLVTAVRSGAAHHQDPGVRSWTKDSRVLVRPRFLDGFARLAERNLAFEAWVYSHDLPDVAELARRYPEVTIVLDHLGMPAGLFGPVGRVTGRTEAERRAIGQAWRDDLAAVAAHPNVVAKLSGLTLPVLGHRLALPNQSTPADELVERLAPLLDHALDVFGPERLMWGSNAPLAKPVASVGDNLRAVATVVGARGQHALDRVFTQTAERVYRITAVAHPATD